MCCFFFFFNMNWLLILFILFQNSDKEEDTEMRLQNCVARCMILKRTLVIIVYVADQKAWQGPKILIFDLN